jgi:hypothetical protein
MVSRREALEILDIGSCAISPYNTQPWRFLIRDNAIDIYILRTKNFFLKLQGVSHMTLGCLLENLEAGARHLGYRPRSELLGGILGVDRPCARLHLELAPGVERPDVTHIRSRTTNRRPYRQEELPPDVMDRIVRLGTTENITVHCATGEARDRLADILVELESVRLANYKMAREALEYIRFSESDRVRRPEGLDVRTLEYSERFAGLLRLIQRPRVYRVFKLLGAVRIASRRHRAQLRQSAALITYALARASDEAFVDLGRRIQHTLNELTAQGVHSMAVLSGLYLLDVLRTNPEIFSGRQLRTLHRAKSRLEAFFGIEEQHVVFIFRTGFADAPSARQGRRPTSELLIRPPQDL